MNIGGVIKDKRQKRNMTQAELAALLHVTPQAVSRWEMGISYPDIAMVPRLSEVLEVSADELLGIRLPEPAGHGAGGGERSFAGPDRIGEYNEHQEPALNQSQADSIFDYVPAPPAGNGKRVLVVDDADFMRMVLEDILTRHGHTVLQARNGQECLDILQSEAVDVCVLDIVMPIMDGIETLRRMKESYPGLKAVMLSALSRESCVKQAMQLGADAFVVKPFQEACLIERIG